MICAIISKLQETALKSEKPLLMINRTCSWKKDNPTDFFAVVKDYIAV